MALICALEVIPERLKVGVADILSLKVAVIVTTSELETRLSESVSVSITVGTELSIVNVILSVPAYALPDKSVPEAVAVVEVRVVETVQAYVQTLSEMVAFISVLEVIPERLKVGVVDILSLKVAVIVTTSELETRLSESVSVSITVGTELSIVNVILSVPAYALPDKSVPETVAVVEVTREPETVHVYDHSLEGNDCSNNTFVSTPPLSDKVGVTDRASEKPTIILKESPFLIGALRVGFVWISKLKSFECPPIFAEFEG